MTRTRTALFALALASLSAPALAMTYVETPSLSDRVQSGELPPVAERVPAVPEIVSYEGGEREVGRHGGAMRLLMGKSKDIRMMMVYGYARLVGYNEQLDLVADLVESYEVKEGREFTFKLRPGHRWSDGEPFTSEAFRYYWEDIVNNEDLYPFGLPSELIVDGEKPTVEYPDETTVRYTWPAANPNFLPALAGPRPLFIYAPGHYLKQFHASYISAEEMEAKVDEFGVRNWAGLHHRKNHPYKMDNPDLPMLQPWINTTWPPSERYVFKRNPFYHRVDSAGNQLPYVDEVLVNITSNSLVAAKTGAGESDLQGRYIRLDNFTFLKEGEARNDFSVRLWRTGSGSQLAIYPNMNHNDPVWRELTRDRRFRQALSIGIDRTEINQVIYSGLALESNNLVQPSCPLSKPEYQTAWTQFDPETANQMLDELGLDQRNKKGVRLMKNGEPIEIILHTAGESTEETDILELIGESWGRLGIKLHTKPSQREVFRERVFSGDAMMAMFNGVDNGLPTANMNPGEFAPTDQTQLQWPKWGQYFQTNQQVGEAPDIPEAERLLELYHEWRQSATVDERAKIWEEMLDIHAREIFTIGIVCGVPQPIVVNNKLHNVPSKGIYAWLPTSYFGVYRPDTFWFE